MIRTRPGLAGRVSGLGPAEAAGPEPQTPGLEGGPPAGPGPERLGTGWLACRTAPFAPQVHPALNGLSCRSTGVAAKRPGFGGRDPLTRSATLRWTAQMQRGVLPGPERVAKNGAGAGEICSDP